MISSTELFETAQFLGWVFLICFSISTFAAAFSEDKWKRENAHAAMAASMILFLLVLMFILGHVNGRI